MYNTVILRLVVRWYGWTDLANGSRLVTNLKTTVQNCSSAETRSRKAQSLSVKRVCVQGLVAIPMMEVIQKKILKDTFQLDAAKHGQLQLQLRWMSILQGA